MVAHINETDEETVLEHNLKVADYARRLGECAGMGNIAYITGYFHDLGKFTASFEKYIRKAVKNEAHGKGPTHSTAGGKYIYDKYANGNKKLNLTATVIAWSVFSHHGLNDIVDEYGHFKFGERLDNVNENDYNEAVNNFIENNALNIDELFEKAVSDMTALIGKINAISCANDENKRKMDSFYLGLLARLNLSFLIEADRTKTAEFMTSTVLEDFIIPNWEELFGRLENYLHNLSDNSGVISEKNRIINAAREEYSRLCEDAAEKETGIYRLDMPTGAGKTLASLRFALKHAEKSKKKRIIYVAPYKSILTQTAGVYRDIFGSDGLILEHHSDVIFEEDEEDKTARYHTENWRSGIVITTMVQFLYTLFGGKTQQVRRFQALTNAIIIVDEIQSLPVKCTYMFNAAMNFLQAFNTTVILCSATQPVLDEVKIPIKIAGCLINEKIDVRMNFKRNDIVDLRNNVRNCDEIARFAYELIEKSDSGIIILNTKRAALEVYNKLVGLSDGNVEIFHISTNMCPSHQKSVIDKFKNRLKNREGKMICVSTTVLEAGVDVSAQWVIRSMTGWDSVMQAAGRCNRSGENDNGYVYVVDCSEENIGSMEDMKCSRDCAQRALRDYDYNSVRFDENLASNAFITHYYRHFLRERSQYMDYPVKKENMNLFDLLSQNEIFTNEARYRNKNIKIGLMTQAFKKAGETFKVISQDTQGVIVPYEDGEKIISDLAAMSAYENPTMLIRKAQSYTVNLWRDKFKYYERKGMIYKLENVGVYCLQKEAYDEKIGISEQMTLDDLIY